MNVDIKEISSCKKQISATLKPEDVKKTYNEVFNMFKAQVKISGFRQGKAPEAMIKSRYKKEIEDEVGKKLLNESVPKMLKDKGIEPISASLVNDININLDESVFSFEMEVEVNPVIELKDYKKIKIEKEIYKIEKQDVNDAIENLRQRFASYNPVEGRAVKLNDYCTVDFVLKQDETVLEKQDGFAIEVEKDKLLPGLAEELAGAKIGEIKEIKTKLPDGYPDKKYAGKDVDFEFTIKEIKEKVLPELDDEFAKDVGKYENFKEFKKQIEKDLEKNLELESTRKLENDLVDKITAENDFEVPSCLVEFQHKKIVDDTINRMKMQRVPEKNIKEQEAEIKESLKKQAVDLVKIGFIFQEIAEKEKIKVSDDELNKKLEEIAAYLKKDIKEIRQEYEKSGNMKDISNRVLDSKIMDFLIDNAEIKEKVVKKKK